MTITPEEESKMSVFVRNHGELLFAVLTSGVLVAYGYGINRQEINELRKHINSITEQRRDDVNLLTQRIGSIEKEGTGLSHSNKWILEQHAKEIIEVKSDNRKIGESISEMKTDIRLIAAWVRQQNGGKEVLEGSSTNSSRE